MTTVLFQYSLSVSIPLFILWVTYRCVLADVKHFSLNRFVLLAIYGVSLTLGPVLCWFAHPDTATVQPGTISVSAQSATDWIHILSAIWLIGAVVVALFSLIEIFRIYFLIKGCTKEEWNGVTICITDRKNQSPFSFGKHIVMSRQDFEKSGTMISAHEQGHIQLSHSLDMIVAQLLTMLCWYNPAAWLMRSELRSVHEFQADCHALNSGINARDYQLLLVSKATGTNFPSIGNNFNHGKLKKRIAMMNRPGGMPFLRKFAYIVLPVASAAAVMIMNVPEIRSAVMPRKTGKIEHIDGQGSADNDFDVFVDNRLISKDEMENIKPDEIKSITVYKDNKGNRIEVETKHKLK